MRLRKQVDQPLAPKFIPVRRKIPQYTGVPANFDTCPKCGNKKAKLAKLCWACWSIQGRTPVDDSVIIIGEERCRKIALTHGKYALVDEDLYDKLIQFRWSLNEVYNDRYYAYTTAIFKGRRRIIFMQHVVANDFARYDHKNGDGCDNRRSNLRLCSHSQNLANVKLRINSTSGYIGVCWFAQTRKWQSHITVNYKRIHLGYFTDPTEAAKIRDIAALKYFGEFAVLNFPITASESGSAQ